MARANNIWHGGWGDRELCMVEVTFTQDHVFDDGCMALFEKGVALVDNDGRVVLPFPGVTATGVIFAKGGTYPAIKVLAGSTVTIKNVRKRKIVFGSDKYNLFADIRIIE